MPRVRLAELSRLIAGLAVYILCTCFAQAEILSGRVVKIAIAPSENSGDIAFHKFVILRYTRPDKSV
jgi:hypothetical protein